MPCKTWHSSVMLRKHSLLSRLLPPVQPQRELSQQQSSRCLHT
jgi:hypothetical protein